MSERETFRIPADLNVNDVEFRREVLRRAGFSGLAYFFPVAETMEFGTRSGPPSQPTMRPTKKTPDRSDPTGG